MKSIRWAHDSIEVRFKNGGFLVDTLKELLSGLQASALPKFSVWQRGPTWFALTGNRRLWVLKEFSRMTGQHVQVPVRRLSKDAEASAWFRRMFTTRTDGESVCFVASKHHYPSMSLALASLNPSTAPNAEDLEIGHLLQSSPDGVPMTLLEASFQTFSAASRVRARPDLFSITPSASVVFASAVSAVVVEAKHASSQGSDVVTSSTNHLPKFVSGAWAGQDARDAQEPASQDALVQGNFVSLRKHTAGGAVFSFQNAEVRQNLLANTSRLVVGQVNVDLSAYVDSATACEVPTDLLAAWGKGEQSSLLSICELVRYFDAKHEEMSQKRGSPALEVAEKTDEVSCGMQAHACTSALRMFLQCRLSAFIISRDASFGLC